MYLIMHIGAFKSSIWYLLSIILVMQSPDYRFWMIKTALIYLVQYNLSKFKNGRYGLPSMLIYVQITHLESLSIIVILWHHNLKFSADEKYYGPIWCVIIHQNPRSTYMVQRTYSIILILLIHYTHPNTPSTTHNPNTPQTPINPTHSIR